MTFIVSDITITTQHGPVSVPAIIAVGTPYAYHLTLNDDGSYGPRYSISQVATGRLIATDFGLHRTCKQFIEVVNGVRLVVAV